MKEDSLENVTMGRSPTEALYLAKLPISEGNEAASQQNEAKVTMNHLKQKSEHAKKELTSVAVPTVQGQKSELFHG